MASDFANSREGRRFRRLDIDALERLMVRAGVEPARVALLIEPLRGNADRNTGTPLPAMQDVACTEPPLSESDVPSFLPRAALAAALQAARLETRTCQAGAARRIANASRIILLLLLLQILTGAVAIWAVRHPFPGAAIACPLSPSSEKRVVSR